MQDQAPVAERHSLRLVKKVNIVDILRCPGGQRAPGHPGIRRFQNRARIAHRITDPGIEKITAAQVIRRAGKDGCAGLPRVASPAPR